MITALPLRDYRDAVALDEPFHPLSPPAPAHSLGELTELALRFLGEDRRFVLYCASGWRSALAAKTLRDMGMDNVAHVEGGFNAWKAAGGPVGERPAKH